MKLKLFLLFFVIPFLGFANMAKPWVDGSSHSVLFSESNCTVKNESIFISLFKADYGYGANYKIKYTIISDSDQILPLAFLGIGLNDKKMVLVNNAPASITPVEENAAAFSFLVKKDNYYEIKYSESETHAITLNELIYFQAKLKKGENTIYIEYSGDLEYNTYGFLKKYKLRYSLYPSKFWKSFGPIKVTMNLENNLEVNDSNIGKSTFESNSANWEISKINQEEMEITVTERISVISKILLFIEPIGLAFIFLILMAFLHFKLLKRRRIKANLKYNFYLPLGIIIVPLLFYVLYFLSYDLIDFSLRQESSKHGYVFLYVVTYPVLLLVYGIMMWQIDLKLKKKYQ